MPERSAVRTRKERGEGKIKAIIWTAILVFIAYTLFKIAPPLMDKFQLEDTIRTEARFGAVNRKSVEDIRETVWKKVRELEIEKYSVPPVRAEDIKVEYSGRAVNIGLRYTVPIDLMVYSFDMKLTAEAGDKPLF